MMADAVPVAGMTPEQKAAVRETVRDAIADYQGGCMDARCTHPMSGNCECALSADAAMAAHIAALEAAGYAIVPVEPTDDMVNSEFDEPAHRLPITADEIYDIWRAMLAARPR